MADAGLVDEFGVGALEQQRDVERRAEGVEGLTAFVGIGILHVGFAAIAPGGDGVAAAAIAADHGFRGDRGEGLEGLAGLVQELARLDDAPVPVLLVLLVVLERGDGLGEQRGGAILGDGRECGGEKKRQEPAGAT